MSGPAAEAASTAPRRGAACLVVCLVLALAWGAASAQRGLGPDDPPLPPDAEPAFAVAVAVADVAAASPLPWSPDAPAWRTALAAVRAASAAAPEHPAALRLQFRTYALVGWWSRAAETAEALDAAAQGLEPAVDPWDDGDAPVPEGPTTRELLTLTYAELGYARYQAGALPSALTVFERWLALAPDEPEALRWMGRIWLELGDPAAALPYWTRLAELRPDDEAVAFFAAEARLGVEVGPEAGAAFRRGMAHYDAGQLADAASEFDAARSAAPDFVDAHAWAGRVALESGRPADAVARYQAALALRPDDAGLAYFLRVAETQAAFGVAAGRAFFAGLTAYESGDLAAAAERFRASVAANERFGEAWAWLGRVRQEQGSYAEAEAAWAQVVALDPGDERARGFLNLAREQRAYEGRTGGNAAADFAAGVAAFERADFAEAAARFDRVVAADPGSGLGWTWVGRVAYTVRDFEAAAAAFERARELLPDDDDVAWFAEDAAARAEEALAEESDDGGAP